MGSDDVEIALIQQWQVSSDESIRQLNRAVFGNDEMHGLISKTRALEESRDAVKRITWSLWLAVIGILFEVIIRFMH